MRTFPIVSVARTREKRGEVRLLRARMILAVLLLVNFLFTGLTSWVTEDEDREWWDDRQLGFS